MINLTKPGFPDITDVDDGNSSSYWRLDSFWSEGKRNV